tara:strand:- start:894 stop:1595 length:702 start_codon:yes stop_codon:yes gene_type:complete
MKIIFTYLLIIFPFSLFSHDKGIDEIIKKFILEHPEVLIQSLKNYSEDIAIKNESEIKNNISEHQKELFDNNSNTFIGKKNANIVVVEFFDYNCSYCLKAHLKINELLKKNSNFKVILKHLPILSESSEKLARLAMALSSINRKDFLEFHEFALKNAYSLKELKLNEYFESKKIDYGKLKEISNNNEITKLLNKDILLAKKLGVNGTPAFVINGEVVTGWIGKSSFSKLINQQ